MVPLVSVIVEGDNEPHSPDSENSVCLGLRGLLEQDYPPARIDLVMVGSSKQVARWRVQTLSMPFSSIRLIPADETDYYEMKLLGSASAENSILAFLDSDVFPARGWLSALVGTIESGCDASVGLTQLEWHGWMSRATAPMLAFSSISWGAILGPGYVALGFHANNIGCRAKLLDSVEYRSGLLRACAAHGLFRSWKRAGYRIQFQPEQRVVHAFSPGWWAEMHARSGIESLLMRRLFHDWPHRWARRLGPLEPIITAAWRCLRDIPQWWRYGSAAGLSPAWKAAYLPVLIPISLLTRSVEMLGGYRGLLAGRLQREMPAHQRAGLR